MAEAGVVSRTGTFAGDLIGKRELSPKDLKVRVIYYEIVALEDAIGLGPYRDTLARLLDHPREIAILHCATARQYRVTVVCTADHMRRLMESGVAKDPDGMIVSKREFPLAWEDWDDSPCQMPRTVA
jgi:hypothetical protein